LVIFAVIVAAATLTALIAIEEIRLVPELQREQERRVNALPSLLAIANQKAILTNDLATLRNTLDLMMENAEGTGLQYIMIQDADGKVMSEAYHAALDKRQRDAIMAGLRRSAVMVVRRGEAGAEAGAVNVANLSEAEREALMGQSNVRTVAVELPPGHLPVIETRRAWRIPGAGGNIIDYTLPITTGAIRFGGLRIGVVDEISEQIERLRYITWGGSAVFLVVAISFAFFIAGGIDRRFATITDEAVENLRREMEYKIKRLEVEQVRKEEENPISPSEFLALLDYARKIFAVLDYNEVLLTSLHSCLQIMGVRDASIFVIDAETNELVGRVGHDENGVMDAEEMARIRVPVGRGDIGGAAEFGTTTTIDTPRPGAAIVSALVSRGRTIGVILIRNKLSGRPFLKKDQTLLRIFSGLLANAMENAAIFHHYQTQTGQQ
jgi:hypothetical protein